MAERFLLALDQGTTGSTALLFAPDGKIAGRAYREIAQHYPKPGWVEHAPEEIWSRTRETAVEALQTAGVSASQVASIGITNQRETTLLWNRKTGQPIHRAIVWQCRRTAEMCDSLRSQGKETEVREKTGLLLDPYFSATKIAWLLDHVDEARARAEKGELAFGTIDSWLLWKLTDGAVHATDFTNASRTLLLDLHERAWSPSLCRLFGVPESLLPKIFPSSHVFGAASKAHLGHEIPIGGIAGDQQAALFGQHAVTPGTAKCTFGTGAFALAYCGDRGLSSRNGLLTTLVCDPEGKPAYGLEGSVFIAGAVVQWLRDGLRLIRQASETEAIAASVPDTGGVYLVPAFVGLGAPYWDAGARGAIVGLTRGTDQRHIVRAALESIAYQVADLTDAMQLDLGSRFTELRVDGGAVANNFLLAFLADVLGLPVLRPPMIEVTAYGAARLAGISSGVWPASFQPAGAPTRFTPSINPSKRNELIEGWKRAVSRVRSG